MPLQASANHQMPDSLHDGGTPQLRLLAFGTPVGGALAENLVTDGGAAFPAGLPLAIIHEEPLAEVAGLAIGMEEIAEGGAALLDRVR